MTGWRAMGRRWARGATVALAMAMGIGVAGSPIAHAACAPGEDAPWRALDAAVAGVWVWDAPVEEVNPGNGGHVVPTTAVVDSGQALVIDPGPSLRHGQRVIASLRCRLGARVVGVVNTHGHAENVMANAAFEGVPVWATTATRETMMARCPDCLASLRERAGETALAGTRIRWPDRALAVGDTLTVGRLVIEVVAEERGHTESDLVLWWAAGRALWVGGLAYDGRIPELAQGSLAAWLEALPRLRDRQPRHVVGAVAGDARTLEATGAYLRALRTRVLRAIDDGRHAGEPGAVVMDEWAGWAGFARRQGFNLQRAWRELEAEWLREPPASPAAPGSAQQVGR